MSSGSESDEDYVPGEPEHLSEEESADEETDLQYSNEQEQKSKKRKVVEESNSKKKCKTKKVKVVETRAEEPEEVEQTEDPVEQKKKEDDLWAMFLDGTDTKPKPTPKQSNIPTKSQPAASKIVNSKDATKNDDKDAREKRIFEFAGETIVVENNTIKEKIQTADASATASATQGTSSSSRGRPATSRGGLSSVLGALNKSNKLSTLEKSKLDWLTFKKDEGLEEEIQSHNKGKNGYLDKRDFLERADMRQYEIERDLRMGRRSNR